MAEPDEVRTVTRPQWHIRGITRYPSWFGHWVIDNLLRHVLAHLVAKSGDETVELESAPKGALIVTPIQGAVTQDFLCTVTPSDATPTVVYDFGTARPRMVELAAYAPSGASIIMGECLDGVNLVGNYAQSNINHAAVMRCNTRYLGFLQGVAGSHYGIMRAWNLI